jgi:chromosome segregation ATPase
MVFFLKKVHNRIDQLDQNLRDSFERIRQENENLYAWVRYLNEQSESQQEDMLKKSAEITDSQRHIQELKQELNQVPKSRSEIKQMVDEVCSFEPVLDRIRKVEHRIDQLEFKKIESRKQPQIWSQPRQNSALKERVLKRIARNSKDYIKSVMTGIIRKYGKISAMQLREIIVEEQGLCSKSSFYRILEELESERVMNLASRGKEKRYISTQK